MHGFINRSVLEHLLDRQHPDLAAGGITGSLIWEAGEAIADLMLDHGYQLTNAFMDARDVVQSYINPRNGKVLEDVAFTLTITEGAHLLQVLLRVTTPLQEQGVRFSAFGTAQRISRNWYLPLTNSAVARDVLEVVTRGKETPQSFFRQVSEWRAAA